MAVPHDLEFVWAEARDGRPCEASVRELLSWFGAHRRSWRNVKRIREALDEIGLVTVPDFEGEYIDNLVEFRLKEKPQSESADVVVEAPRLELTIEQPGVTIRTVQLPDPAHRISRLKSAKTQPVSVKPDATIGEAITLMLCHDYSQLPVMQSDHEVKGLFSWKSYGSRAASGKERSVVREAMDSCAVIDSTDSLFKAISVISEHDCVLVRAPDRKICGIVTAYDISMQFGTLAEPFLLLGDIENHIRYLIGNVFTVEELQQAKDPGEEDREIKDVSDLTFGEYVRLLQNERNWARLNIKIDRKTFTGWLDKVRLTRNDVMHFDPDPLDPEDIQLLREFASFLNRWQQITSKRQDQMG